MKKNIKILSYAIAILFMVMCTNAKPVEAATKNNPSVFANAPTLTEEVMVDVNKVKPFEVRYYKFVPKKSGRYYLIAVNNGSSIEIPHAYIYGEDGTLFNNGNCGYEGNNAYSLYLQYDYVAGKTYYIGIRNFYTDTKSNADFSMVISNTPSIYPYSKNICGKKGSSLTLSSNYTNAVGAVTYQWYTINNFSYKKIEGANKKEYTFKPTEDGTYGCTVTDARGISVTCGFNIYLEEEFAVTAFSPSVIFPYGKASMEIGVSALPASGKKCTYQWYKYDRKPGTNYDLIEGATSTTYQAPCPEKITYESGSKSIDLYKCVVTCDGQTQTVNIQVTDTGDTMIICDTDLCQVVKKGGSATYHISSPKGTYTWKAEGSLEKLSTKDIHTLNSVTGHQEGSCLIEADMFYRYLYYCVDTEEDMKAATSEDVGNESQQKPTPLKKGSTFTSSGMKYKVYGTKTVTLLAPAKKTITKAVIPATVKKNGVTYKVTAVSDNAFKNFKKLKTVTIGSNVTKIGKSAFYGCKKLKTITIKSKKLKSVGKNAIKNVDKKATIKCPSSKKKAYKKLLTAKTGYKKTMKVK